jgi:hypothetical protein
MAGWSGWVNEEMVRQHLGHGPFTPDDQAWLTRCVDAANFAIHFWRPDLKVPSFTTGGPFSPAFSKAFPQGTAGVVADDPMTRHGAIKLAASMYNRRNSSGADIDAYSQFGGSPPVGLLDAEVQAFLGLGRHHMPQVS